MYVYFDDGRVLKEIITEDVFRVGDSARDKIYVYWDGNHSPSSGFIKYRLPDGTDTNDYEISMVKVGKELPSEPLRNLKFFSYDHTYVKNGVEHVGYEFYEITVPDVVLSSSPTSDDTPSENNMIISRIRFVFPGSALSMGALVFSVETNVGILTDDSINVTQYNYLLEQFANKFDKNCPYYIKAIEDINDVNEPVFEPFASTYNVVYTSSDNSLYLLSGTYPEFTWTKMAEFNKQYLKVKLNYNCESEADFLDQMEDLYQDLDDNEQVIFGTHIEYLSGAVDSIGFAFNDSINEELVITLLNTSGIMQYEYDTNSWYSYQTGWNNIRTHLSNHSNPHQVTKAQVGLGNVVNTGDSATPSEGGTTKFTTGGAYTEFSKYVLKSLTIAGLSLTGNITKSQLLSALNVEDGAEVNVLEGVTIGYDDCEIVGKKAIITRDEVMQLIGVATDSSSGYMTDTDHVKLTTLYSMLGDDSTDFVDTIQEVLEIFQNYPEGADIVNVLSGKFDKDNIDSSWSHTGSDSYVPSEKLVKEALDTKENLSNKTTTIDEDSTDTEYPSAKAVYSEVSALDARIDAFDTFSITYDSEDESIQFNGATVNVGSDETLVITLGGNA